MKRLVLGWLFLGMALTAQAQYLPVSKMTNSPAAAAKKTHTRLGFYGGFGLGFTSTGFYADLQPGIIYRLKPEFHLGANAFIGYQSYHTANVSSHQWIYGYDLLALYLPWRFLELSADYQDLTVKRTVNNETSQWEVPAFYLGVAYRTGRVAVGFRYDLLFQQGRSIYPTAFTPFVRIYW